MSTTLTGQDFIDEANAIYQSFLNENHEDIKHLLYWGTDIELSLILLKYNLLSKSEESLIKEMICESICDALEGHIAFKLEEKGLMVWDEWCSTGSCEAYASIYIDEKDGLFYISGRIKTYVRIHFLLREDVLRDPEKLEDVLSTYVADAAEQLEELAV